MRMDWIGAVFLHWPVDASQLRDRIPDDLRVDTFEGTAWVSIVAFRIAGARPRGLPPAAAWRTFPEINVRTYVTDGAHPGVWFLSLDAPSRLAVLIGNRVAHLPYYGASIASSGGDTTATYRLTRTDPRASHARLSLDASFGVDAAAAPAGGLDHWLVERYCFYAAHRGRTLRGDMLHDPWPLRAATAHVGENTLLAAAKVVPASSQFIAHASTGVATRALALRNITLSAHVSR